MFESTLILTGFLHFIISTLGSGKLKDRFIDHGIIASINIQIHKNRSATLDSFVMSCRVFDKDLENFILLSVKKKLIKLNINKINTFFIKTDRNKRFYNFYKNFNFEKIKSTKDKDFYSAKINNISEKQHFISKTASWDKSNFKSKN